MTEDAPMVLVGVDGSEESAEALRWALRYADCAAGTVRAVIAWRRPMELGYYAGLGTGYGQYLPIDPQLATDAAAATLAAIVRDTASEKPTVAIEQRIVDGHPASVLIDQARSADLLVVGARGHSAVTDLFLGSVSSHCVHHANCPVVVVRHQAAASADNQAPPRPGNEQQKREDDRP